MENCPIMPPVILRLICAGLPLALVPLWFYLLAEGYMNFGGGDKDILLTVPLLAWSALYLLIALLFWQRPLAQACRRATFGATVILCIFWTGLFAWSMMHAGQFG